jgi:hypothetical protein
MKKNEFMHNRVKTSPDFNSKSHLELKWNKYNYYYY